MSGNIGWKMNIFIETAMLVETYSVIQFGEKITRIKWLQNFGSGGLNRILTVMLFAKQLYLNKSRRLIINLYSKNLY
jgi:hypothetical protein